MHLPTEAAGSPGYRQRKRIIAGLLIFALIAFAQGPSYHTVANSVNTIRLASACTDASLVANTVTCSTAVGFVGYVLGQSIDLRLNNTITGAATININGLGVKAITYNAATPLIAGIMVAGGEYRLTYDGIEWVLQGSVGSSGGTGGGGLLPYSAIAVVLSGGTTPVYIPLGGGGLGSTTEASVQTRVAAVTTFSNVCVVSSIAPGGGNSLAVTLRDNAANTAITLTISGAAVSACDTTHTVTNVANDLMDWSLVPSGVIALFSPNIQLLVQTGTVNSIPLNNRIRSFGGSFDGGTTPLTPGKTTYVTVPFGCTISAWNILATPADTATLVTWKIATGTAIPTVANSISTAGESIASGTAIHSTNVSDFTTTTVSANDIIGINLFAVGGTATFVNYVVECDQ